MRVITGTLRGKRLITLDGESVRPTTDKTKEAIFSIIQFDLPNAEVLDLFAGSGQLGIEALSRGAKNCVFVDKSRESIGVVRRNIENCKLENSSRIHNCDAAAYLKTSRQVFDIAILDPPYGLELIPKILSEVDKIMKPGGTVVCEHEAGLELPEKAGGLTLRRRYGYGKLVALTVYDKDIENFDN